MGWAPNGRSYVRLRDVLRRLKSLTIRYENAWWDAAGRGYEEEVATGIISGYRIARQVSGPRTAAAPQSWASWTQQFHDSLKNGNLKRLNLDLFFRLSSPTAQRTYRFLDKRFYNSPTVTMDLVEFACGHVGLTESHNVAVLKRRLAPALAELEKVGFLAPMDAKERYQKLKPGVWRVRFQAGAAAAEPARSSLPQPAEGPEAAEDSGPRPEALAAEFYRQWDPAGLTRPGFRDVRQAEDLIRRHGAAEARALVPLLVQVTRKEWPECRSLSGAVQKYLPDALKFYQQQQRREVGKQEQERTRQLEQEQAARQAEQERRQAEAWERLTPAEQAAIRQQVHDGLAGAFAPEAFVRRLCLEEAARRAAGRDWGTV
jgi:hypothetical protein